jgi:hypothetical protein
MPEPSDARPGRLGSRDRPLPDLRPGLAQKARAMISAHATNRTRAASWNHRRYWVITGLFCLLFLASAALILLDPQGTRINSEKLGFPPYIAVYPSAAAKIAGVVVILWRRWPTLRMFAFAGFLYDMVLALMAHIHESDFPSGWLAVFGIMVWCGAIWGERDRVAAEATAPA